jgi:hypothetical protein
VTDPDFLIRVEFEVVFTSSGTHVASP